MIINLELKFEWIKRIFANEESKLLTGDHVLFSKRTMLSDIYKQLPHDCKLELIVTYPKTLSLLERTNMLTK